MKTKGLENQQKIIQSATELFYQKGYNQTSFTEIAKASGLPRGNFYYYFKSKDDILAAVVQARVESLQALVAGWERLELDPKGRLRLVLQMVDDEADNIVQHGCPLGSLAAELGKEHHLIQAQVLAMFEPLVQWLEKAYQQLGSVDAKASAMHLMGRLQGIAVMAHIYQSKVFLHNEIDSLMVYLDRL